MKRFFEAIFIVAVLCVTLAVAADTPIDFSGKWALENSDQTLNPITPMRTVAPGALGPVGGGSVDERRGGDGGYLGGEGKLPTSLKSFSAPDLVVTITQTPTEINLEKRWSVDGQPFVSNENYKLDGKENIVRDSTTNAVSRSKAKWRKNGLALEIVQQVPSGGRIAEIRVKQEFSFTKEGQVLSIKTTQEVRNGQVVIKQTFKKAQS